ncbi:hypothetical protein L210DRAFT_3543503 [Boletus edulis BED1]|uniref:Uncharacterized protein n=1 Tax=Boletus edulis BED1 TaxID=1328754 RepID=A0AAD4BSZ5_BOLED|nr:hypothetical protein L210DRAFT_3543503 [Boletus edulis BED1]
MMLLHVRVSLHSTLLEQYTTWGSERAVKTRKARSGMSWMHHRATTLSSHAPRWTCSSPLTHCPFRHPAASFFPTCPPYGPGPNGPVVPRQRVQSAFHPMVVKAAFTTLGLMHAKAWADYALLHVPIPAKTRSRRSPPCASRPTLFHGPPNRARRPERVVGVGSEERCKNSGCAVAGAQKLMVGQGQDGYDVPIAPGRGARAQGESGGPRDTGTRTRWARGRVWGPCYFSGGVVGGAHACGCATVWL